MRAKPVHHLWRILNLLALVPLPLACHGCFSEPTHSDGEGANKSGPMSVYIDIGGDPSLARRFSTFFEFSMEDAGIVRVQSKSEADFVIDGEVTEQKKAHEIGVGIVHAQLSQNGKLTEMQDCATLNSDANGELFDGAAKNTVSQIRGKFPGAHTIRFDPGSDTKESGVFGDQLPSSLRNEGFNPSASGSADIVLHVSLSRQKVAVNERLAKYDIEISGKDGNSLSSSNGTTIVSAKLATTPPETCPNQFDDLRWLAGEGLYNDARMLVKSLLKKSVKVSKSEDRTKN